MAITTARGRTTPPRSLREYREAQQLSQREAAEQFEISQTHWCRLEAGTRRPRPRLAARLAKATRIPLAKLLGLQRVAGLLICLYVI